MRPVGHRPALSEPQAVSPAVSLHEALVRVAQQLGELNHDGTEVQGALGAALTSGAIDPDTAGKLQIIDRMTQELEELSALVFDLSELAHAASAKDAASLIASVQLPSLREKLAGSYSAPEAGETELF